MRRKTTEEALQKWSKKLNLKGYRRLLFPVNLPEKAHWTLLIIDLSNDLVTGVTYYDLFYKEAAREDAWKHLKLLLPLLRLQGLGIVSEVGKCFVTKDEDGKTVPVRINLCPDKQPNNYDCGTLLLYFVECICLKKQFELTVPQEVLDQMRVKILLRLVSGEFDLDMACNTVATHVKQGMLNTGFETVCSKDAAVDEEEEKVSLN